MLLLSVVNLLHHLSSASEARLRQLWHHLQPEAAQWEACITHQISHQITNSIRINFSMIKENPQKRISSPALALENYRKSGI